MAQGGREIQLGGYDYEFVSPVPDKWTCPICFLPLKNPVQVVGCGHRFCELCMNEILKSRFPKCPTDRKHIAPQGGLFTDIGCNREMQDLCVKCLNEKCQWTGRLRLVEKHMTACKRAPTNCVKDCGAVDIPRDEMEKHLNETCPKRTLACSFKFAGCVEMIPFKKLDKHLETKMQTHLMLTCKKLEQLDNVVKQQVATIELLLTRLEEAELDIDELHGVPPDSDLIPSADVINSEDEM